MMAFLSHMTNYPAPSRIVVSTVGIYHQVSGDVSRVAPSQFEEDMSVSIDDPSRVFVMCEVRVFGGM